MSTANILGLNFKCLRLIKLFLAKGLLKHWLTPNQDQLKSDFFLVLFLLSLLPIGAGFITGSGLAQRKQCGCYAHHNSLICSQHLTKSLTNFYYWTFIRKVKITLRRTFCMITTTFHHSVYFKSSIAINSTIGFIFIYTNHNKFLIFRYVWQIISYLNAFFTCSSQMLFLWWQELFN